MTDQIIAKLDLFASRAIIALILVIVVLVILRMIADVANLNFFGGTYVTIRRLTDPVIVPVRGALRGFRVDPKYAPLVTILIAALLGWLGIRLADTILGTIAGVLLSIRQGSFAHLIGHLLYGFLVVYSLLIFARIVFSWVTITYSNRLMRFLVNTTEPLLGPLRRTIPPFGMFDLSALVALIIIWVLEAAVAGTLLRN